MTSPEPTDIVALASAVVSGYPNAAVRAAEESVVATCDPDRTEQVLHTLLANACPVARSAVEVTVPRVSGGDGRGAVELEVRDDGPGFAAAALAGLFEPVPSPGRGNVGGRGLGLYVSREVARAQGGDLALEDTDSGGTTFLLTLREES